MVQVKSIHELIQEVSPYYKNRDAEAIHKLIYDSSSETLEPVYFFILDLMNDMGLKPEKLLDNFSSAPGSGHFAELGQRATIMQQNATKILGDVNTVLRSVLNIVYDLKDFKTRLQSYDNLNSNKKEEQEAARLSLKQIWLDKVDINKGNSSIKAMSLSQTGFQTLLDAFLYVKDEKEADKLDLNDRVKRVVKPRIQEFNIWLKESERELRKRYELEKTYLKSQVNSLTLYTRWAKPYLRAAQELETKEDFNNPALVKVFNTLILELTLLGKTKLDLSDEAVKGNVPLDFGKKNFIDKVSKKRDYYSCVLVDFVFRGIPQRVTQQAHYAFGGRVEVTFKAYALNQQELDLLKEKMKESDLDSALNLIEGATSESLAQLKEEINSFLEEPKQEEKNKEEQDTSNPFLALFGKYEKKESEKIIKKEKDSKKEDKKQEVIEKDDWIEKNYLRRFAAENSKEKLFDLFNTYKKSHGMPSYI